MYQTLQPLIGCCYRVDRMSAGLAYKTISILSNIAVNKLREFCLMNALFDVKDKVVVLAGYQGRLGVNLADCLIQEGAILVLLGPCPQEGWALVEAMVQNGGDASFFEVDPKDTIRLTQVQEDIMLEYGHIDALVYEFEALPCDLKQLDGKSLFDRELALSDSAGDCSLAAFLMTTRLFLKAMLKQQEGAIVGLLDYPLVHKRDTGCTCQRSMDILSALMTSLARELMSTFGASYRVNALVAASKLPDQFNPENVQGPLQFLLSEASSSITGSILLVDGGIHIFEADSALATNVINTI